MTSTNRKTSTHAHAYIKALTKKGYKVMYGNDKDNAQNETINFNVKIELYFCYLFAQPSSNLLLVVARIG